jgi:hypothetical protein
VSAVLVDLEAEAQVDGSRIRDVEVVTEIQHRHVTERHRTVVPERYAVEWRCRDRRACDGRQAPQPMTAPAPAPADEESVPWWE